jgi:hypothetical protein
VRHHRDDTAGSPRIRHLTEDYPIPLTASATMRARAARLLPGAYALFGRNQLQYPSRDILRRFYGRQAATDLRPHRGALGSGCARKLIPAGLCRCERSAENDPVLLETWR